MDIIVKFLSSLVDSFKMKNPIAFAVIAIFLLVVYYGSGLILDYEVTPGVALINESIRTVLNTVQNVLVIVLTILGAHTPASMKIGGATYVKSSSTK